MKTLTSMCSSPVAGKNIDKDVYGDDLDKIINTQRFVPDKGFSGAEGSSRGAGPVQVRLLRIIRSLQLYPVAFVV